MGARAVDGSLGATFESSGKGCLASKTLLPCSHADICTDPLAPTETLSGLYDIGLSS